MQIHTETERNAVLLYLCSTDLLVKMGTPSGGGVQALGEGGPQPGALVTSRVFRKGRKGAA